MKNKNKKKSPLENSFFLKNHKGELTTQQIVTLIILVVSFSVILFLIFRLNLGETTTKEICHNSVLMKGKGKGLVGELDCRTNYVCISGGGKCEGINPAITVDIDLSKLNAKNETMKAIAEEMADCWWMFGEGKVNYGGLWDKVKGFVPWTDYHCAICSVVKFDDKVQEKFNEITYNEFYDYLKNTKKDNTQTYLKYLYDVNTVDQFQSDYPLNNIDVTKEEDKIYTNEKYSVITGAKGGEYLNSYIVKSNEIKDKTECDVFDLTKA